MAAFRGSDWIMSSDIIGEVGLETLPKPFIILMAEVGEWECECISNDELSASEKKADLHVSPGKNLCCLIKPLRVSEVRVWGARKKENHEAQCQIKTFICS